MRTDKALVLRSIPYSDNTIILKCFTALHGVLPFYYRIPKKRSRNLTQSGSFIEITSDKRHNSSIRTIKELRWDTDMPIEALSPDCQNIWVFTLELLNKSLAEELPLKSLHERIYRYYVLLLHDQMITHPLISLLNVSCTLGIMDVNQVANFLPNSAIEQLKALNWTVETNSRQEVSIQAIMERELERFMSHFSIQNIESLYLVEDLSWPTNLP